MKFAIRIRKNKDKYKILICICVILLHLHYISFMPFRGFYDDLVALAFATIIVIRHKNIKKNESTILLLLLITLIIGVISNFVQGIVTNLAYMLNDALSFMRIFVVFIGTTLLLQENPKRKQDVLYTLSGLAKGFILISFVFACLTQMGIVEGMYERVRFGIKCFTFVFHNASQYGILIGCSLGFVLLNEGTKNKMYELMACAVLIMTGKGMSLIIVTVYLAFICAAKFGLKKTLLAFGIIGILLAVILRYQIVTYLLDSGAPRAILLKYGLQTAVRFFPFGSGLATFGSNMAAEHYSPLYVEYGFRGIKSLSGTSEIGLAVMNDVYLGMVLAEYGFIGTALVIYIFYKIFAKIWKYPEIELKKKYIVIACFISACGMAVMAGSLKNVPGEMIFLLSALYCCGEKGVKNVNIFNNS